MVLCTYQCNAPLGCTLGLLSRALAPMGGVFVTPITEHMTTMNEKAAIIGFENHNRVVLWLGLLLCQNALYVGKSNWL